MSGHAMTPLHEAIDKGTDKGFEEAKDLLLKHRADPNVTDGRRGTPLMLAARKGSQEFVLLLLRYGAHLDLKDQKGRTALHWAAMNGHYTIVEVLLHDKADPNMKDDEGKTPITLAANEGHVETFKVLQQTEEATNILHRAAEWGQRALVAMLLQHDGDPNSQDSLGKTPLSKAAEKGHFQIVELLLQNKAIPNVPDNNGDTAIISAAREHHFKIVEILMDNSALTLQPNNDSKSFIDFLKDNTGMNIEKATRNGCFKTVEFMLKNGDKHGHIALLEAAKTGNNSIIELLLKYKVNIHETDKSGNTAIIWAASGGHLDTVELLLSRGASENISNKKQRFAIRFLQENYTFKKASQNGHTHILMAFLEQLNDITSDMTSAVNYIDKNGRTLLHWSAHMQNLICMEKLLNAGANINAEDSNRDTALHLALRDCKIGCAQCAKLLLERGPEIEGHGKNNTTVLHEAARKGASEIIEFLMRYNANININMIDSAGNTPLKLALDHEKHDCATLMIQRGAKVGNYTTFTAESANIVSTLLRLPDTYEAKIANIGNF